MAYLRSRPCDLARSPLARALLTLFRSVPLSLSLLAHLPSLSLSRSCSLSLSQLVLQLAILLYVVLFQIVRGTSYLKLAAPTGSLRFSLLEPLFDPTCTTGCVNTLSAKELLPYCASYNGTVKRENAAYPCVFVDGIESQRAAGASMMVTTRITEQAQTRACNENVDNTCPSIWRNEQNRSTQFTVQVRVQHICALLLFRPLRSIHSSRSL